MHNENTDIGILEYIEGRGLTPNAMTNRQAPSGSCVNVIYTDLLRTQRAVTRAAKLAKDLGTHIEVSIPYVVPYPLPLDCPAAPMEAICRQISRMAVAADIAVRIHVLLCRDKIELLRRVLPRRSIAILAPRKLWFGGRTHMERALSKQGCVVIRASKKTVLSSERPRS
jgi:hypothetical protein